MSAQPKCQVYYKCSIFVTDLYQISWIWKGVEIHPSLLHIILLHTYLTGV